MSKRVPRGILAEAKLCPHGYACLSEGNGHVCQAERLIPDDGVFIPGDREVDCPYAEKRPGGISCSCPVRIELFKNYGL
ncbi:MAG: hypothetical protein GF400_07270 [Candidatus Eisenbacteria bacterium]|nr:hypothetical protein [Candidatus Eisenbacteria bacterium]